ncbi:MAG: hypothetical protein ACOCWQ_05045 [Nanoarchaeota archaeon]
MKTIISDRQIAKLKEELGDNLVSIIRYEGDKVLIVVMQARLGTLNIIASHMEEPPLVLRRTDVNAGLDVFPVDFLNIYTTRHVVYGEDVFEDMKLPKKDLRTHLEFEIRSKLIVLRNRYLNDPKKAPQQIITHTIDTIAPILRGLCGLHVSKLANIPTATDEIVDMVEHVYDLDMTVLRNIYKKKRFSSGRAKEHVNELLDLLTKMCDSVDTLLINK